ncbi:dynein assembly factor 5, axonemal-like [Pecten maximus]|uniref:dynein assembly factor 5, axonemal-like n=1 Tax=Pecten maximus TaxID=6579 RepID=UPI0014580E97|nr:dynein assembly factor 5, axonemal-like [Pecten maximus]
MATIDQNSNSVLQGIARHINCLSEDNRNTRKRALEGIRKDTVGRKPSLEQAETGVIFSEIIKPLLKCFSDPVEKCRELAILLVKDFLKVITDPQENLPYIMPILVQRLGQQDIVETSEELRLELTGLLLDIVEFSGKKMAAYLDDCIKILAKAIIDPFPEVRKESCKCAAKLAKAIPEYFQMMSESLIKPLLMTITHQHSRVRVIVVETIGDVILYGNGKSVDTVVSHLAQRLFDQSPAVRKAVIKVVGTWLLDLPDRYSFHHKLIPLLLTGITDEQPDIQELADTLWYDTGMKYEKENEEELKDKIDFEKETPPHYPPNVERPNFGCRTLMMRHFSKILPGLMRDVLDWVVETRIKSASLLYTLLINTEDYVTQHLEPLLTGMYRASVDEEKSVVANIRKSSTLVGYFVAPDIWSKLVFKAVKTTQSFGCVLVLGGVIKGTERALLLPYLDNVCDVILTPDVCNTVQVQMHVELLSCVEGILTVAQDDAGPVSQKLFNLLLTILAQAQNQETADKVYQLLDELCKIQTLESRTQLFSRHTRPLLLTFTETFGMWNLHSVERQIFDTLVLEAGPVIGDLLGDIIPVMVSNLNPEKDPEVRLKFFSLLSKLVMSSSTTIDSQNKFGDFSAIVVKDMVIPNCVWSAGRTAGAIRTTAVSCMWALLQSGLLTQEKLAPVVEDLLTQMITAMDDSNKSTRLIACRVMTRLFELSGPSLELDRLHNMYPELLKRLDDSDDEIRITVAKTWLGYLGSFDGRYDAAMYKAHVEAIYKGLLVHLDDPDARIQKAILEVLSSAASLIPNMLIGAIEDIKHKHRSQHYCEELLSYTKTLITSS